MCFISINPFNPPLNPSEKLLTEIILFCRWGDWDSEVGLHFSSFPVSVLYEYSKSKSIPKSLFFTITVLLSNPVKIGNLSPSHTQTHPQLTSHLQCAIPVFDHFWASTRYNHYELPRIPRYVTSALGAVKMEQWALPRVWWIWVGCWKMSRTLVNNRRKNALEGIILFPFWTPRTCLVPESEHRACQMTLTLFAFLLFYVPGRGCELLEEHGRRMSRSRVTWHSKEQYRKPRNFRVRIRNRNAGLAFS